MSNSYSLHCRSHARATDLFSVFFIDDLLSIADLGHHRKQSRALRSSPHIALPNFGLLMPICWSFAESRKNKPASSPLSFGLSNHFSWLFDEPSFLGINRQILHWYLCSASTASSSFFQGTLAASISPLVSTTSEI